MNFHRTASGLTNLHIFVSVDVIIFVEGGRQSFSIDDVAAGLFTKNSVDLKFWQNIFTIFLHNGRKLQFRAIGAKTTISSIADLILNKQITNVWVAMDRDHDCFHDKLRIAPGILYTYGYSWENDVCIPDVIENAFWALVQIEMGSIPVRNEIEDLFAQIHNKLRKAVYLDILISFYGGSLFPRDKPHTLCSLSGVNNKPSVNLAALSKLIRKLRRKYPRPIFLKRIIDMEVARDCAGSVIACFYYRVLQFLLKRHARLGNIEKKIIDNIMIEKLVAYFDRNRSGDIFAHYAGQFAMLYPGVDVQTKPFAKTKDHIFGFISYLKKLFSG